ncbi:unnamed protein product, partial [Rotaria socialis]
KKCHGNRRDQRFRRKCRAEKMKPAKIKKLIEKRNRFQKKNEKPTTNIESTKLNKELLSSKQNYQSQPIITTNLTKRKRDISSQQLSSAIDLTIPKTTSSISIAQSSSKKMKNISEIMDNNSIINRNNNDINKHINYRQPMYLTRSSSILYQILNKALNYSLKKKDEKQFINVRLQLLDQQYCLEMDRQLWQSYLDIGLQQHLWPDQFYTMAKTNDFDLCKQYVMNYMENNKRQLNHCQFELTKQEEQFQTFLDRERKYLSKRNNEKLLKFKDDISEKQRLTTVSTNSLMNNQENEYINRLIAIREKQAEIWKEQLMLEIRIHCKFLPQNFDHLENFISTIDYLPLNNNQKAIEIKNKRFRIIQEAKRQWLNYFLNIYEIKIQEYEQQYQNEFIQLESLFSNNNDKTMLNNIKGHINNRINRLKKDIYDKTASFRRIMLQNRQRSSSTKNVIGVSPEPYLDLISNPFDKRQWNYLSFGPSYIRVNQSAIRPKCQQETEIKNQHKDIYSKVENHLTGHPHLIPRNNPIFKQYSDHLLDYLNQTQILGSIRRIIQNRNLIIRVTDKGNNFYIGSALEFEQKATKFFSDTNAFIELSCNPFNEILDKVIQLLNTLRGKDLIRKWQYEQMMPDRTTCELAHLYFNPKTHKDGIPVRPIESTIHASTTKISKFLDKILRPIFDAKCKDTTIIDGASLITELSKYNKKGLLKSTTLFCTFDIRNLYTMLPQEETLDTHMKFLHVHGYRKVKGISIDTIKKLASIILKDNVFAYGKKIYKQTTVGAMG